MKVCFVNPPFKAEYGKFSRESRSPAIGHSGVLYYPLWLIYAAALTEQNGFAIEFIDAPAKQWNEDECLAYIQQTASNYDLFVLDTSTPSIYSDLRFAASLKRTYPNSFIVLVGTHPTATVNETMDAERAVDAIARGEYDVTILELAKALSANRQINTVLGLSYRSNGHIIHNDNREPLEELDQIPMAAKFIKEHLDVYDYVFPAATYPAIQIFTGRGCPARCNYCVYPQVMHGHKYRQRTTQNVVEEFLYIAENFPDVKEIVIEDDTFTIEKKRVLEICEMLIANNMHKRFKWLCNARVNLDYETMKMMKKAGCRLLIPGVESFNQEILKNIKKGTTTKQIEEYMLNARRAGLLVHACYMVGNPGETKETMQKTLEAALRFNTDTAQFFPLIPYPGTEAYDWAKKNGYITGNYEEYCHEDGTVSCVLNRPELSAEELVDFCSMARRKYYLRPRYILHRLYMGLTDFNDLKRSLKAFGKIKKTLLK
jgi:hypothetical protein